MATIDKRLDQLEAAMVPQEIENLTVINDKEHVIFRNEYSPEARKWITTINREDLRDETLSEIWYSNGRAIHCLEGISVLDI